MTRAKRRVPRWLRRVGRIAWICVTSAGAGVWFALPYPLHLVPEEEEEDLTELSELDLSELDEWLERVLHEARKAE